MPRAKTSAGTPSISMITATIAPAPNSRYATGWWLMKPSTSAFMMDACGAARIGRASPTAASPNWYACASMTMAKPAAMAAATTPRNFTRCCAAGVEPSQ